MAGVVRAFALDPTTRGLAFAVLEGPERLIDWGHTGVPGKDVSHFLAHLEQIAVRYRPDLLVLEEPSGSFRRERVREWLAWAEEWAAEKGLAVAAVSRQAVKDHFSGSGTTKHEIATAISRLFPELKPQLPRKRKIFDAEDRRMAIFSAVSFALAALSERS